MVDHTKSHTVKYSPIPYFIIDNNSVMRERLLVPLLLLYNNNDGSGRNRYEARFGDMTLLPAERQTPGGSKLPRNGNMKSFLVP